MSISKTELLNREVEELNADVHRVGQELAAHTLAEHGKNGTTATTCHRCKDILNAKMHSKVLCGLFKEN